MQLLNILAVLCMIVAVAASQIEEYGKSLNSTSTCVCTTVPCPVVGNNYLIVGGGAKGTYVYKQATNSAHSVVVSKVSITITKADLDQGTDTTSCTQDYSRSLDDDGTKDCDAGHILAHRLGGPGSQPINIFPQAANVNRGIYAQFENDIYDCITGGASSASLSWSFSYASSSHTKPSSVEYSAKFASGGSCTSLSQTFNNNGN